MRTLLIWLLVLALPAQGAMAATMAFCGPKHHTSAVAVGVSAEEVADEHAPAAAAHVAHGQSVHSAAVGSATADTFAEGDLQTCSVCASCCSAAAIHSSLPKLPRFEPVTAEFAIVSAAVESFAADGPDRPPRQFLA